MPSRNVVILGGGLIGCSIAEEFARHGQRVLVVERGRCGQGSSSAAAGMLSSQVEFRKPGPLFDFCSYSRRLYPRWIENLRRRTGLKVPYSVNGLLYVPKTHREEAALDKQIKWQGKQGLRVEKWGRKQVVQRFPLLDGKARKGFFFTSEAQIDSVKLIDAVLLSARKAGVEFMESTEVQRILIKKGAVDGIKTAHEEIEAPIVINCLGAWANMGGNFPVELPVKPVRGQMFALQGPKNAFRHVLMSRQVYFVQRSDGKILVGATAEDAGFENSVTAEGLQSLFGSAKALCSGLMRMPLLRTWSGLRPGTQNGLPLIGKTSIEGLYAATGHYRHGILLAPATATSVVNLVLRGRSEFDLAAFQIPAKK